MQSIRAYRIHGYGGPEVLHLDDVPIPTAGSGQILVEVKAAGVNGLDWKIREGLLREISPMSVPAVLGCELTGVVTGSNGAKFGSSAPLVQPSPLGCR